MTPKQKYDERKRLRLENDLRAEQKRKERMDRGDEAEQLIERCLAALEKIAEVAELWADLQTEASRP